MVRSRPSSEARGTLQPRASPRSMLAICSSKWRGMSASRAMKRRQSASCCQGWRGAKPAQKKVSLLNGASQVRRTALSSSAARVARNTARLTWSSRESVEGWIASSSRRMRVTCAMRRSQASGSTDGRRPDGRQRPSTCSYPNSRWRQAASSAKSACSRACGESAAAVTAVTAVTAVAAVAAAVVVVVELAVVVEPLLSACVAIAGPDRPAASNRPVSSTGRREEWRVVGMGGSPGRSVAARGIPRGRSRPAWSPLIDSPRSVAPRPSAKGQPRLE